MEQDFQSPDFLKVLLTLKDNIMRSLNVADVGIVSKIEGDDYYCTMLNDPSVNIVCAKDFNLEVQQNDTVLIVFTNSNFKSNLQRIKNDLEPQKIPNTIYHSCNYGIITNLIYRKNN